jgi:hypothetical protein
MGGERVEQSTESTTIIFNTNPLSHCLIAFYAAGFSFLEMVQDGGLMLLGDYIGIPFLPT